MNTQIKLPIVERKSNGLHRFLLGLILCGFILMVLSFSIWNIPALKVLSLVLILLGGVVMQFFEFDEETGRLILTEETIQINNNEPIPIGETSNLALSINGYEGRRGLDNFKNIFPDDGKSNFIQFEWNQSTVKLRFFVSDKNYQPLIELNKKWKQSI
jgi:hypothetical protein